MKGGVGMQGPQHRASSAPASPAGRAHGVGPSTSMSHSHASSSFEGETTANLGLFKALGCSDNGKQQAKHVWLYGVVAPHVHEQGWKCNLTAMACPCDAKCLRCFATLSWLAALLVMFTLRANPPHHHAGQHMLCATKNVQSAPPQR